MASPRGGAAASRDLQSALSAVEAHLQQLLLNSSTTPAANVRLRVVDNFIEFY